MSSVEFWTNLRLPLSSLITWKRVVGPICELHPKPDAITLSIHQLQCMCSCHVDIVCSIPFPHGYPKQQMSSSMSLIGAVPSDEHLPQCSAIVRVARERFTVLFFRFLFVSLLPCCYFCSFVLFLFFLLIVFVFCSFFLVNREEEERYVAARGELCGLRSKDDSKLSMTHKWSINWVVLLFSVIPASSASY